MRASILSALAALTLSSQAWAADLTVMVRDAGGQPVKDAVVTLKPADGAGAGVPIRFSWPYSMAQQNIAFDPFVLVVPVGSAVTFPNRDKVRHHVYSFSPAKRFELKLYGREEARTVVFDKAGVVALGCNIHDQMIAYVVVVDTAYAAKTGADGVALIRGAPAGNAAMTVWQPYMKAARNQLVRPVAVPAAGGRQEVTVDLRPAPGAMSMTH